jgi:hypothetical protein
MAACEAKCVPTGESFLQASSHNDLQLGRPSEPPLRSSFGLRTQDYEPIEKVANAICSLFGISSLAIKGARWKQYSDVSGLRQQQKIVRNSTMLCSWQIMHICAVMAGGAESEEQQVQPARARKLWKLAGRVSKWTVSSFAIQLRRTASRLSGMQRATACILAGKWSNIAQNDLTNRSSMQAINYLGITRRSRRSRTRGSR